MRIRQLLWGTAKRHRLLSPARRCNCTWLSYHTVPFGCSAVATTRPPLHTRPYMHCIRGNHLPIGPIETQAIKHKEARFAYSVRSVLVLKKGQN